MSNAFTKKCAAAYMGMLVEQRKTEAEMLTEQAEMALIQEAYDAVLAEGAITNLFSMKKIIGKLGKLGEIVADKAKNTIKVLAKDKKKQDAINAILGSIKQTSFLRIEQDVDGTPALKLDFSNMK